MRITARQLIIEALKARGCNGLYWRDPDGCEECGCGFDDFISCGHLNLDECVAAKQNSVGTFNPQDFGKEGES